MNSLFHYDGYLNRILTKLMYIAALNLLFLICSIPVITVGASCTAMYTVLFRFVRNDEPDILKTFFKAFRENLKKASCIWAAMLAAAGTLAVNYYALYHMDGGWTEALRVFFNFIFIIWVMLWVYIFPAAAYYKNSVLGYFQFSVRVAIANLPVTAAIILIQAAMLLAILFFAQYMQMAVILLICCVFSLPAYFSTGFLVKIFERFEDDDLN